MYQCRSELIDYVRCISADKEYENGYLGNSFIINLFYSRTAIRTYISVGSVNECFALRTPAKSGYCTDNNVRNKYIIAENKCCDHPPQHVHSVHVCAKYHYRYKQHRAEEKKNYQRNGNRQTQKHCPHQTHPLFYKKEYIITGITAQKRKPTVKIIISTRTIR